MDLISFFIVTHSWMNSYYALAALIEELKASVFYLKPHYSPYCKSVEVITKPWPCTILCLIAKTYYD